MRLKNKVAIITEASGGLGINFCKAFLKESPKVGVNDISKELVDKAVKELTPLGPVIGVLADVCQRHAIDEMLSTVLRNFVHLDILVNNAGGSLNTPYKFEEIDENYWDKVMDVILKGSFLSWQAAITHRQKQG